LNLEYGNAPNLQLVPIIGGKYKIPRTDASIQDCGAVNIVLIVGDFPLIGVRQTHLENIMAEGKPMTSRELIQKLFDYPLDCEVCSTTKDEVTFGVLEPDGSAIHLITLEGKKDLQEKLISQS